MARLSVANYNNFQTGEDVLYDDIWALKARQRMTTARERIPLAFTSMSSEAAAAMQQLSNARSEDQAISTSSTRIKKSTKKRGSRDQRVADPARIQGAEHVCSVKLSEVYEKLGVEQKLEGDITDPNTWEERENQTKFVLGGGKMENAMEIVEIVNADDPKPPPAVSSSDIDEHVIAEIARINSINKCNVWFEAHETLLEPTSAEGDNPTNNPSKGDNSSSKGDNSGSKS